MASGASGAASGAAQGAAAGSVVPGWGTLIGGVVGAIGGYIGGIAQRKAEMERARLEEKIMNLLSIKKYNKFVGRYLPIIRSQIEATIGPQLRQTTAGQISEHGLTGTGLGEVLRSLAQVAPGIEAVRQAGEEARTTQVMKARALGARIERITPGTNPILAALSGGAQGAYSGFNLDALRRPKPDIFNNFDLAFPTGSTKSMSDELFPSA
jgi:hypothetical protein